MSIQKQFILRYRADGHVRFQIPVQICHATIAETITHSLLAIDGVYRVNFYIRQQKLSIRYQETVCDFTSLTQQLYQILNDLQQNTVTQANQNTKSTWRDKAKQKLSGLKATQWAKQKYTDAKETVQAAKVITNLGIKKPKAFIKDPEKAVIDFFNDILVLFLIKLHWEDITQKWLLKPLKHRYEWMALFYMFFLLVRARRKK